MNRRQFLMKAGRAAAALATAVGGSAMRCCICGGNSGKGGAKMLQRCWMLVGLMLVVGVASADT